MFSIFFVVISFVELDSNSSISYVSALHCSKISLSFIILKFMVAEEQTQGHWLGMGI